MQNFAKSILNYFAAFNETRFRFTTRAAQKWSNNELSLDFSVFPEFEHDILTQLQNNEGIEIEIKPRSVTIVLDQNEFAKRLLEMAESQCTSTALTTLRADLEQDLPEGTSLDSAELYRSWNLAFRKQVGTILLDLQEEKKQELIAELDIDHLPLSTLNATSVEQDIFEAVKKISLSNPSEDEFIDSVSLTLAQHKPELVMYDLYSLIQSFHGLTTNCTIHLFLHELIHQDCSYPIATLEVHLDSSQNSYTLKSVRNLVQLNTPAINSTKMGRVLTTPRACAFPDLSSYIAQIEMYFQAYYHHTTTFFFQSHFKKLVGQNLPIIAPRIGLQIIEKEDRKLLDYSELITNIDSGPGKKFVDLVTEYVDGNVEHNVTYEDVNADFNTEYPPKSAKQFLSDIPLILNANQKKILTAAKNPKNRIMRIDGPPGTGKSYTITALVYLANQLGKTVLITSHKPQALDVVEEKLIEQFRDIHPYAKPPLLRLTKPDQSTLNSIDNTLSDGVINQTMNRSNQVNTVIIASDIERIEQQFTESINNNWETGVKQYEQLSIIENLALIAQRLDIKLVARAVVQSLDLEIVRQFTGMLLKSSLTLSLEQYSYIADNQDSISSWKNSLAFLNHTSVSSAPTLPSDKLTDFAEIVEQLATIINPSVTLDKCDVSAQMELPVFSHLTRSMTPQQLSDGITAVRQLKKINSQLKTKVFGNEEKRRLEHTLKLDFPPIAQAIQEKGVETTLFDLERDQKLLDTAKTTYPWLSSTYILNQAPKIESIQALIDQLTGIEFTEVLNGLSKLLNKTLSQSTLTEIQQAATEMIKNNQGQEALALLKPLAEISNIPTSDTATLLTLITAISQQADLFSSQTAQQLATVYSTFPELLSKLQITQQDLKTLNKLFERTDQAELAIQYINLYQTNDNPDLLTLQNSLLKKQQEKRLRLLVQQNEVRFSTLNKHPNEVQKILTAIRSNQRLSSEQAQLLLKYIPCVIAPPDLISQFLPMDADMLDWLIIDEASQVSIAESLSLMLRAKQTIIFGDELQYGAVGATNVSLEYSKEYFRNVLEDYIKDKNEPIDEATIEQIATDVSRPVNEEDVAVSPEQTFLIDPNTKEWLKTFSIRTSTLDFAKAIRNYSDSLTTHFRSYPEIIGYSNETFYKPSEINLVTSRIRTRPIGKVLEFIKVKSKGLAGNKINLDEIEAVQERLARLHSEHFAGSIGIICSFREQTDRMKDILRKDLECYAELVQQNGLKIWFVGDVQGEERDVVLYSFVEDKSIGNADLSNIYPVVGGAAESIRNLRMQRLNVGFSRAKDMMIFVHSMELKEYKNTWLGDALEYYWKALHETKDNFISDTSIFGSPREEFLYSLITQTEFYHQYQDRIKLIAQFEIGKYLKEEFRRYIPDYRVDFLLTITTSRDEHPLIIEYDGVEFHTKNAHAIRSATDFDQEFIEYDIQRQMELESYGYQFLRINKFTLIPKNAQQTEVDVINELLFTKMKDALVEIDTYQAASSQPAVHVLREDTPKYQIDGYNSPMEKQLDQLIRQAAFFQEHQDNAQLFSNYDVHDDLKRKVPEHIPHYQVDFLLTISDEQTPCKLVIEYDGIKFHTDHPEQINSGADMEQALTERDDQRQHDLEELGYIVIRVNKFTLFDNTTDELPVERVDRLLRQAYESFCQRNNL